MATPDVRPWPARPKPSSSTPVPHIGHAMHLCDRAEKGTVSLEEMKTMVRDAKFICKDCGRVANKAEYLCQPLPL